MFWNGWKSIYPVPNFTALAGVFRDNYYHAAVDTNNATEAQNKLFKYSFLPLTKPITTTITLENHLPCCKQKYLKTNSISSRGATNCLQLYHTWLHEHHGECSWWPTYESKCGIINTKLGHCWVSPHACTHTHTQNPHMHNTHIHEHTCTLIRHTHTYMNTHARLYDTHTHTWTHMHARMTHTHTQTHVHTHMHMYTHLHVCTHHIHTVKYHW